ncbi:MAG TPA: alpha-L-fucosidase C-terminal domain-containing protein [Mucilaginibacter sp.]
MKPSLLSERIFLQLQKEEYQIIERGENKIVFNDYADQKDPYNARDIRFTTKGDILYVTSLGLPVEPVSIKALSVKSGNGKIAGIKMLGSDKKVTWKQKDDELVIEPSKNYPSEYAVSYAITFVH